MASKIVLKNAQETEFSITHKDNVPAKSLDTNDLTYTRVTVVDMEAIRNPQDGDVCFVKDLDRGGSFIYDSSEVGNDNQGINFNGWIRQYSDAVNVKWFGASSSNADNLSQIQKALDFSKSVNIGKDDLNINGSLSLSSGHTITSQGGKIQQTAPYTQIFTIDNISNVTIDNVLLEGIPTEYIESFTNADGVQIVESSNIAITNCKINGFAHCGVIALRSSGIKITNNFIKGVGASNLVSDVSGQNVGILIAGQNTGIDNEDSLISGNTIYDASMGIQTGDQCNNTKITENHIYDITGQHGVYVGAAQTNLIVSNNTITNVDLEGIKLQQYDTPAQDSDTITVIGNTITNAGQDGILCTNTTSPYVYKTKNLVVSGNTIRNAGQDGINIRYSDNTVVTGNTVDTTGREGISVGGNYIINVADNNIKNANQIGIREAIANTYLVINNNTIIDPAIANITSNDYGILTIGTEVLITNNRVIDTQNNMRYGIFTQAGDQTTNTIKGNFSSGAKDYGFRTALSGSFRFFGDNVFNGTLGNDLGIPVGNHAGNRNVFFAFSVPTTGTWVQGSRVYSQLPTAGGNIGWVCTASGTPGTWKSFGTIEA